jgi:ElaB/YqjD/DUF883 family membrane-anchored ribosome-binding protein
MENSAIGGFERTGQALADKAAGKAQAGVAAAKDAVGTASSKVDSLRRDTSPAFADASRQVQATMKRGWTALTDMATDAGDFASNASDSIVTYTKENPVKSLALAAASGALIYAAIKAVRWSRN